jgi:5-methyltetrahydrofolate--homocysteine methyltransferase
MAALSIRSCVARACFGSTPRRVINVVWWPPAAKRAGRPYPNRDSAAGRGAITLTILDLARERVVLLDGAMGTAIQALNLPEAAYGGHAGCLEILGLTAPDRLREIHRAYLAAGADVVETDTFGGSPLVLAEYDLAERTEEINEAAARLARQVAEEMSTAGRPRFVAGSVGPGTKLASLGQIDFDALVQGYRRQIGALLDGGVDLLLIETVQDLLQAKAALAAAQDVMAVKRRVPLYVSVTVEQTGTLLTGTDMAGVIAVLEPFPIDIVGLNCATGPRPMRPHLETLSRLWPGLIGVYPNAGLPLPSAGGVSYPETPEELAATLSGFLDDLPINIVGGCCGTTPAHIARLAAAIAGRHPPARAPVETAPAVASLFGVVTIRQDPPPLYIGERANATGSKAFRDTILAGDYDAAFEILIEQAEHGSHAADLSVAYAGQDESRHMDALMRRAARECPLPICIDSNLADVVELALKRYPGRAIVNSINLEDGGKRADLVGPLAKRFGAGLICLTIDEAGMAMTAARKLEVARRLVDRCVEQYGLRRKDLFVDALTFTVGSGDPSLKTAASETITAIRHIKAEIPGVYTLLGVSNVSFGLSMKSRRVLNSVFLDECLKAGLDAAILNPKHIVPLALLEETDVQRALNLIHNRAEGGIDPLEAFINHFAGRADLDDAQPEAGLPPAEAIRQAIIKGRLSQLPADLDALLAAQPAEEILNDLLVPAMKHVGELFGAGKMQLPFVLKSAEAMKRAVDHIKPRFSGASARGPMKKLLLATVRGDVHDIGKNLVDIIVSNNGFEVINLGTKVPVEVIETEIGSHRPDAVGMSGLLVTSAMVMAENLRAMADASLDLPVLVGGAALTPEYVRETLKPAYPNGSVTYCADAFAGLKAMQEIAEGRVPREPDSVPTGALPRDSFRPEPLVLEEVTPPEPPFWGDRVVTGINLDAVAANLNEIALFRGRWGYRRGSLSAEQFERIMRDEVRPRYRELWRIVKAEGLFEPRLVYGYFHGRSQGDAVVIDDRGRELRFDFPRRRTEPRLNIADFVRTDGDVVGFFVVTLGEAAVTRGREVFSRNEYLDYFLLHGLAVEITDALAEYAHTLMRHELGIGEPRRLSLQEIVTQAYRGSRYGFGYPACPDLSAHKLVWELLHPERIGISLAEGYQMVPEYSTAAIVIHHPQAKYFSV